MEFKKIDINNKYTVKVSFEETILYQTLIYFYAPIIGMEAAFLYMFLLTETKNMFVSSVYVSQERIITLLNKSPDKLEKLISKLELIGLLSVYVNPSAKEKIMFILNKPLSQDQFLNSKHLSSILSEKIGKQNIIINSKQFKINKFVKEDDLISLTNEFSINVTVENDLNQKDLKYTFDFKVLYELLDQKGIDYLEWDEELHNEISSSVIIYDLSLVDVVKVVKAIKNINLPVTAKTFSDFVRANKAIDKNAFTKVVNYNDSTTETQIKILESLTPTELIFIQFERTPNPLERDLIITLNNEYNLPDVVINTLINHSFLINGSIVPNYILKIANTLVKHKIINIEDVRDHLKAAYKMGNKQTHAQKEELNNNDDVIEWD